MGVGPRVLRLSDSSEMLSIERFNSLFKAQVLVADWRDDNTYPPHSDQLQLTSRSGRSLVSGQNTMRD